MDEATRLQSAGVAPVGVASPPASTPPARALPAAPQRSAGVPLRDYFARMGIEVVRFEGVDLNVDDIEVCGFAPAGKDGKPDLSRLEAV